MKEHHHDTLTPAEVTDRVWELAADIKVCMFTTWTGKEQSSRPMTARLARDRNAIYFLTDVSADLNTEVSSYPTISLAWADNGGYKYAVISGDAAISDDRARISELWSEVDKAWWENSDDPTIRLVTVTPKHGEVWDSPGRLVSTAKMLIAAVTGTTPNMGVNAETKL